MFKIEVWETSVLKDKKKSRWHRCQPIEIPSSNVKSTFYKLHMNDYP